MTQPRRRSRGTRASKTTKKARSRVPARTADPLREIDAHNAAIEEPEDPFQRAREAAEKFTADVDHEEEARRPWTSRQAVIRAADRLALAIESVLSLVRNTRHPFDLAPKKWTPS